MTSLTPIGSSGGAPSASQTPSAVSNVPTTPTPSTVPSVVLSASTPGFEAFLSVAQSAQQLLGLKQPLSAADMSALLGQATANLKEALTIDQENSDIANFEGLAAEVNAAIQLVAKIQTELQAETAAKAKAASDQSRIASNQTTIAQDQTASSTDETQIASLEAQIAALQQSGSTSAKAQIALLEAQIASLQQDLSSKAAEIGALEQQDAALQADKQAQTAQAQAAATSASANAASLASLLLQLSVAQATAASLTTGGSAASQALSAIVDRSEKTPEALLLSNLKSDQDKLLASQALTKALDATANLATPNPDAGLPPINPTNPSMPDQKGGNETSGAQYALAVVQSALAAIQALATLGVAGAAQPGGGPQPASGVVVA